MKEINKRSVLMVGAGSYLPSHVMTNDDLSKFVETDDSWIKQRTGIDQRHVVAEGEKTSDLAVHAAQRALENAKLSAADIDIIIIATTTPDDTFPSTASVVQHKLEAYQAFAFDVQAVCGFILMKMQLLLSNRMEIHAEPVYLVPLLVNSVKKTIRKFFR